MLKPHSGVGVGELPVDAASPRVAIVLPCLAEPAERVVVRHPGGQAVPHEHADLYLRHVQPRPVPRREVDLQAVGEPPRLLRRERRVERGRAMGVEVVHHEHHLLRVWMHLVADMPDDPRELLPAPPPRRDGAPRVRQRLEGHEDVRDPVPDVLVVALPGAARPCRQALAELADELAGGLVEADDRAGRVVGALVDGEHVLHGRYELRPVLGDAPLLDHPWAKLVFFSRLPTATWLTDST